MSNGIGSRLNGLLGKFGKAVLYAVSLVIPRDESVWVFGSGGGNRFAENSKYLYLHVANNHSNDVRAVWISRREDTVEELRSRGYEAYLADSRRGKLLTLRAGSIFFTHSLNDVVMACALGARTVNLWHGIPLKCISLDDTYYMQRMGFLNRLRTRLLYRAYDYIVTTSDSLRSIFSSAFAAPEDSIVSAGYPRNDVLLRDIPGAEIESNPDEIDRLRQLRSEADESVILYAPTWRETRSEFLTDTGLDFDELDAFLQRRNAHFVMKLHPNTEDGISGDYDRISMAPNDVDIHAMLKHTDALITDYSSIYFDYLLLDRPLVFFAFDLQRYRSSDRELYFEYEDVTPGPKPQTFEDLLDALDAILDGADEYADRRTEVRDRFFDEPDGHAAERVYQEFAESRE